MKNGLLIAVLVASGMVAVGLFVLAKRVANDSIQQSPNAVDDGNPSLQVESIILEQDGWINGGPKTLKVTDPVEIERVVKCFPDVLSRPKSNILGGWQPDVTLRIRLRDKSQIVVEFSAAFRPNGIWRSFNGDFPAETGAIEVIGDTFKSRTPAEL